MSENADSDPDHFGDGWMRKWEEQCRQDWEDESNMEDIIQRENEREAQRLWMSFQNCATAIAQLYKGEVHILHRLPFSAANRLFVGVAELLTPPTVCRIVWGCRIELKLKVIMMRIFPKRIGICYGYYIL